MTEVISKRNKKPYLFLLIAAIVSIITSVRYMRNPTLYYIALPMLIVCALLFVLCIILLINTHGAIERVGDTIIIRRGIRKCKVNKNDILDVFPTPYPNKPNEIQKNVISLRVLDNGIEKTLICGDIVDAASAIEQISNLIQKR